jgi:FKBP-type peptidyl-prolyl cis-trans isomerase SlyD
MTMTSPVVEKNKVVELTYTITDERGDAVEVMDIPVSYLHGGNSGLFEQVEQALEGKGVGDQVKVTLAPRDAFGEWDPRLTYSDALENVPPAYRELGAKAEFTNEEGETLTMVVTHVDSGTVTLDGNHPLAGKTVTFHVTVKAIRDPSPEELRDGVAGPATPQVLH